MIEHRVVKCKEKKVQNYKKANKSRRLTGGSC